MKPSFCPQKKSWDSSYSLNYGRWLTRNKFKKFQYPRIRIKKDFNFVKDNLGNFSPELNLKYQGLKKVIPKSNRWHDELYEMTKGIIEREKTKLSKKGVKKLNQTIIKNFNNFETNDDLFSFELRVIKWIRNWYKVQGSFKKEFTKIVKGKYKKKGRKKKKDLGLYWIFKKYLKAFLFFKRVGPYETF